MLVRRSRQSITIAFALLGTAWSVESRAVEYDLTDRTFEVCRLRKLARLLGVSETSAAPERVPVDAETLFSRGSPQIDSLRNAGYRFHFDEGQQTFSAVRPTRSTSRSLSWRAYSRDFQAMSKRNIESDPQPYIDAIQRGDAHIDFLRAAGYRFHMTGSGQLTVDVPSMYQIVRYIRSRYREMNLPRSRTLVPARLFSRTVSVRGGDEKQIITAVPFGEPVPAGLVPYNQLIEGDDFARLVASGYFPLGEPENFLYGGRLTSSEHDLAHFSGFIRNPRYMAALRRGYDDLLRGNLRLTPPSGRFGVSDVDFFSRRHLTRRMFHALEMLSSVTPARRREFVDLLASLNIRPSRVTADCTAMTTVAEFEAILSNRSHEELKELLRQVSRRSVPMIENLGGATRDIATARAAHSQAGNLEGSFALTPQFILHYAMNTPDILNDPVRLRTQLARALTALENTSHIAPEEWVRQAARAEIPAENTSIHGYACLSGLWAAHSDLFWAYCTSPKD